MRIKFTLGEFTIENVNIEIEVPDELFKMKDVKEIVTTELKKAISSTNETNPVFKEIKTVSNQQPTNKTTNPNDFKECPNPPAKEIIDTQPEPSIPKSISNFNKLKFEVEKFMRTYKFDKDTLFYKLYAGDDVYIHICTSDGHISLYVYHRAELKINYIIDKQMTITRHANEFVNNDIVKNLIGIFKRYSKNVIDRY